MPKSGREVETPANAEQVPLQYPSRDNKNEASMGSGGARNGRGPYVEGSVPELLASTISIEEENVAAYNEFEEVRGDRGEERPETANNTRVFGKKVPETKTTVRTPLEKFAFAEGLASE